MSEYQWVHFKAMDRPLDDVQLEYMNRQSSRAQVSRREFTNEYHYSGFGGNTREMLRRGYDVHLLFANYGVRFLQFRLPKLPCDTRTFKTFASGEGVEWIPDQRGPAGILSIEPEGDDRYFEYLDGVESFLERIAPAREMLIRGDLRPLYLFWLVTSFDDDAKEPPVPAGMKALLDDTADDALEAIGEFYDIPYALIEAAAAKSLPTPSADDRSPAVRGWLKQKNRAELQGLTENLLLGDVAERHDTLTQILRDANQPAWPMTPASRTFGDLQFAVSAAEQIEIKKEAAARRAVRAKELQVIADDPKKFIRRIDQCIKIKNRNGYLQAANHLKEFGEALGSDAMGTQVQRLMAKYPRYSALKQVLQQAGFDV